MLRFGIRAPLRFAAAALVAAGACIGAPGALAGGLAFTHPMKLPNSPPKGDLQGGEPSVAFDSDGRHVYVVAPGGGENGGVGFWRSADGGRSFPRGRSLGSLVGGGDSDVDVGPDHTVYITDLEVAANALCRSHDRGRTFDSNCDTGLAGNQAGPDSDREWINPSPTDPHRVYLTYHDFATETPLVYRSDAGGDFGSFEPCGPILAPGSDAFQNYIPGGTNVGKPAIGAGGALYVPIFEPDAGDQVTEPPDHFYPAPARHGACGLGMPFQDVTVFGNPNANLANIFPYVVSRGKTVYAAATGISGTRGAGKAPDNHYGVYLFRSRDRGRHWSKPIAVDRYGLKANALASLTV